MGERGPAPKPTAIKKAQGNPGKRPLNKREPQPSVGRPTRPTHMSKEAKKAWNKMVPHLEQMKVLTVADGQMLEATCEAYAEFVQARKVVAKDGHTYERITGHGSVTITVRPEVAIAADAWRRLKQGLAEFGMTPASRSRVQVVDAPSDLDPFSLLPGGKAGSAS